MHEHDQHVRLTFDQEVTKADALAVRAALQAVFGDDDGDLILKALAKRDRGGPQDFREYQMMLAVEQRKVEGRFLQLQQGFSLDMMGGFLDFDHHVKRDRIIQSARAEPDDTKWSRVTLGEDKRRTKNTLNRRIRDTYRQALELGKLQAGNPALSDAAEDRLLIRVRRNEFAYAQNFLDDIHQQAGVMDYAERAILYGNALTEARWFGFLYGNLRANRYLRWRYDASMEPENHCSDCQLLSKGGRWRKGVYSAQELASMRVVPGSGSLTCTTRCHCHLEDVERPKGKPLTRLELRADGKADNNIRTDARGRWHSLHPKAPIRTRHERRARKYQTKRELRRRKKP